MDNLLNLTKALERPLNFPYFHFSKLKFSMRYNLIVSRLLLSLTYSETIMKKEKEKKGLFA